MLGLLLQVLLLDLLLLLDVYRSHELSGIIIVMSYCLRISSLIIFIIMQPS